ncbi:hypothetical protein BH09GEM1_BH09GEM1_04320 [soil metagenome]
MLASSISPSASPSGASRGKVRLFDISRVTLVSALLLLGGVISLCPLLDVFLPIKSNIIALGSAAAIVLIRIDWYAINRKLVALIVLLLATGGISATYWGEHRMMLIPIYVISGALAISVVRRRDVDAFVTLLTWLTMGMLIGAIIALFYAYAGGPSLFAFTNRDGRLVQVYLTTLTNSQYQNFIRPSGLFDEPGALSFVICCIAALRHTLGYDKKVTWTMLLLGLVTTSLAHLLYIVVHAIDELSGSKHMMKALVVATMVAAALYAIVTFVQPIQEIYSNLLMVKFAVSDGRLVGDNRTDLSLNAASYIDATSFWFGINARCAVGFCDWMGQGYAPFGENPLTLLVQWGLLISFPYYLSLAYLGTVALLRRSLIPLGVLLLLLQRPYTMSFGYSVLILLTIAVVARKVPEGPAERAPAHSAMAE